MRTDLPAWIALLSLQLSLLISPTAAQAENPCATSLQAGDALQLAQSESGIAGSGRASGEDSGIGGTGLHAAAGVRVAEESGIGGTGYSGDESGIGGTGIYGTITAFGSICVNGLRIHYDENTAVSVDGSAATSEVLAVGQVVAVESVGRGEEFEGIRVSVRSALTGPITSIDFPGAQLHVMGRRVTAPEGFASEHGSLAIGSRVAVSGLRRGDGVVVATRIARVAADRRDSVSGIARWAGPGVLEVGGVRIPLAGKRERAAVEDGQFVRVSGTFSAQSARLTAASVSATPLLDPASERLSIEGYLQRVSGDPRVWLPGVELDRSSLERALKPADRGQRMRVSGRRDALGRLRIERLRIVERPRLRRDINRIRPTPKPDPPARPSKPADRPAPATTLRPTFERPPERPPERPIRIDRPRKIDRPVAIDSATRPTTPTK